MDAWIILTAAFLYIGLLFFIALVGDRKQGPEYPTAPLVYALALAVYCTSWTYYGAVGRAASGGWDYLAIYLGPILMFLFGTPMLRKILRIAKRQNSSSIADFISSRYGKRHGIAIAISVIALLATVPYIALQLKAVTSSIHVLTQGSTPSIEWASDTTLLVAMAMIAFAILFGTRQIDVSQHHRGLMLAIAFESIIKLIALVTVAGFVIWVFFNGPSSFIDVVRSTPTLSQTFSPGISANFITQTLLAAGAILCLPRQFHIAVVENLDEKHLNTARWVFPAYLLVISLVIMPITSAGLLLFPLGEVNADTYVLNIPISMEYPGLTLFAFIGGFSSATAMIVVATLSLSTMLSNDVILPLLLRKRSQSENISNDMSPLLILTRRVAIIAIILLAYGYYKVFAGNHALTTIGLLAFSMVVQVLPAMIGGIYWKKANAYGVYSGLGIGFLIWFFTLGMPTLINGGLLSEGILAHGIFGLSWLRPESLFGFTLFDPLTHGVMLSLCANLSCYVLVSIYTSARLEDRVQAAAFVDLLDPRREHTDFGFKRQSATVSDLTALLERFAGARRAAALIAEYEHNHTLKLLPASPPKLNFIRYIERVLAGIIGSSSSRAMVHSVLSGRQLGIEEVVTFFDETTQAIQFNQKLLSTTLENIDQGVSVLDQDLKLVAWNRRYIELFLYPDGFIHIGQPVEELMRYNASRGECGPGSVEDHVRRRMEHLKRGSAHRYIRVRRNGAVIEMNGNPLPGGGFVTTFTDISEHVHAQEALREAKEQLEVRVADRTRTIQEINSELRAEIDHREEVERELLEAKAEAESANASKTRFLALASHDILQPLNAARLYTASLMESAQHSNQDSEVLVKIDHSLQSTEELISTLLEIARLDDNALSPKMEQFYLDDLLKPVISEFQIIAQQKRLQMKWVSSHCRVSSDLVYLRRILQNLISNAIKYTNSGKILVGSRRQGSNLLVQVWDTGPGIERHDRQRIFNDFYRVSGHSAGVSGVGLGLGVVARLSQLLGHPLHLESWPGHGSMFQIQLPIAQGKTDQHPTKQDGLSPLQPLAGNRILCVDNEQQNLDALQTLLNRWGCQVTTAINSEQAHQCHVKPDIVIMDYQLGTEESGIELMNQLRKEWEINVPAILVTANANPEIRSMAQENDMKYLRKPVKPAPLRSLINNLLKQQEREE